MRTFAPLSPKRPAMPIDLLIALAGAGAAIYAARFADWNLPDEN